MFVLAKRISKWTSVIFKGCYQKDRRNLVLFQYVFTLSDLSSLISSNIFLQVKQKEITALPPTPKW